MTPQEDARVPLALQPFAVEARYEAGPLPLPAGRLQILEAIDELRGAVLTALSDG